MPPNRVDGVSQSVNQSINQKSSQESSFITRHDSESQLHSQHSPPGFQSNNQNKGQLTRQESFIQKASQPINLSHAEHKFVRQAILRSPLLSSFTSYNQSTNEEETHQLYEAIDRLIDSAKRLTLNPGQMIVKQGEMGQSLFVIENGVIDVVKEHSINGSINQSKKQSIKHASEMSVSQAINQSDQLIVEKPVHVSKLKEWFSRLHQSYKSIDHSLNQSINYPINHSSDHSIVASIGPGYLIGELSVYYGIKRSASLIAQSKASLIVIDKQSINQLIDQFPEMKHALQHRAWLRTILSQHYLYSDLDDESEKERLISRFAPHHFSYNQPIIRQGESADRFYIVESGKCTVSTDNKVTHDRVPVATIGESESFGEVALLYDCPRSADVTCDWVKGCDVWSIDRDAFLSSAQRGSLFLQHVFFRFASEHDPATNEALMSREQFITAARFIASCQDQPDKQSSKLTDKRLSLMFRLADLSGDSVISFGEFLQLHLMLTHTDECAQLAYRMFDRNQKGWIGREELLLVLKWLVEDSGEQFDEKSIKQSQFMKDVFPYPDSQLSYEKFTELLKNKKLPRFLSNIESDLAATAEWANSMDWAVSLQSLSMSDTTSLASLPTQIKSVDDMDDHLFKIPWRQLIAGGIAGGLSRTLVSPLERLKILFQTQGGGMKPKYTGVMQGLRLIWKEDGLKGMFRGNGSNVIRIMPTVALQFAFYDVFKRLFFSHPFFVLSEEDAAVREKKDLSPYQRLIAGAGAGVASCMITYPLDFIRARLTLQSGSDALYGGIIDGFKQCYRTEGIRGFYRGLWPSLVGIAPYLGLDFAVYEGLKEKLPRDPHTQKPDKVTMFVCGGVAGTVGQVFTYPIDTIRRRLQVQGFGGATYHYKQSSIGQTMMTIVKQEGVQGLYRGLTPNLLKVAPAVSTSFLVYEELRERMGLSSM